MPPALQFILFVTTVFSLYFLGILFIYRKARPVLDTFPKPLLRSLKILYWLLAITFPLGKTLEQFWPSGLPHIVLWTGSLWLAFLLYFFLAALLIAFLRLVHRLVPFMPPPFFRTGFKRKALIAIVALVTTLVFTGIYLARNPVIRHVQVDIRSEKGQMDSLHVVLFSDIHLGPITGKKYMQRIVNTVNPLEPDIILIPGDILDSHVELVKGSGSASLFKSMNPPLGIYATTGNHEFIGNAGKTVNYLEARGIAFLRDTAILKKNTFYLAGREDITRKRFTGEDRKPLKEIISGIQRGYPVILLDHQPVQIDMVEKKGVDLMLSGHTHHGQLWPLHLITNAIFHTSHGYGMSGSLQIYVTSGVSTWGPPVRTTGRSEIISMKVRFK